MNLQADPLIVEALFREAYDAFLLIDPEALTVLEANPAAQRLTGFRRKQLLGASLRDLFEGAGPSGFEDLVRACERTTYLMARDGYRLKRREGEPLPVHVTVSRVHIEPHPLALLVVRDASEWKRTEEGLRESQRESQRFHEQVIASAGEGIVVLDGEFRYRVWNPYMEELTGLAAGEVLGKSHEEVTRFPGFPGSGAPLRRAMAGETVDVPEAAYRSARTGNPGWTAARFGPLRDTRNQIIGILGTVHDITERKQAEEENRKLETQIQHTQKLESLGVLAGGIAHDFNNLLTSILGFSDLARAEAQPGAVRNYIDEVIRGASQAAELTHQLLAYSGKGRFVVKAVDLSELIEEFRLLLEISISKKCVVNYRLAPDLPAVKADPAQLRQVVMNLVLNASEALGGREGTIAVTTGATHCDLAELSETYLDANREPGEYVFLEVSDDGCGMTEETRKKIFDPFFSTKFVGRGLGLAAVLGIVRGHRGALKVWSEPGVGSTFRVLFPASSGASAIRDLADENDESWRGTGTVLLVDDEEQVRATASQMLETLGFSVLTAKDGREGVERFRAEQAGIVLVLLDMTMPKLDGEEAFREMRYIRSGVPTILSSGYNEQSTGGRFVGTGLAGFIQKPYRLADLRRAIRKALRTDGG